MIIFYHENLPNAAVQELCKEASTPLPAGYFRCSGRCNCGHCEANELKKGDLAGFRVHRFTMGRQLILMAYKVENDSLVLYQAGPHENFYKNLKKYLKEIGG